jgi:hypothetical protein
MFDQEMFDVGDIAGVDRRDSCPKEVVEHRVNSIDAGYLVARAWAAIFPTAC